MHRLFGMDPVAIGATGGDRTHDPWLRRPILYPLSYSRINETMVIVIAEQDLKRLCTAKCLAFKPFNR